MKKQLTAEQMAARDARRAKFKALWKQVADTPEAERQKIFSKVGFVNVEGKEFSTCNTMLLALQCPTGTVFGGFRQWIKQGRAVRKGEHGAMIWVPVGGCKTETEAGTITETGGERPGFVTGTVFDISQTDELSADRSTANREPEIQHAASTGDFAFA